MHFEIEIKVANFYCVLCLYAWCLNCLHAACGSNYTFLGTNWTVFWSVTGSNITFGMFGPANGWIGIGFSESPSLDSVSFVVVNPLHCIIPPFHIVYSAIQLSVFVGLYEMCNKVLCADIRFFVTLFIL